MATYNGQNYIDEQIASIGAQGAQATELLISDDRSSDDTVMAAKREAAHHHSMEISVREGPATGMRDNFCSLICTSEPSGKFVAFSDQDDVWLSDKYQRAVAWLQNLNPETPGLFCGRTRILRDGVARRELSALFKHEPQFRNAIVQSIAGGNTMVMNRAAFELIRESLRRGKPAIHDWWSYMIVTGAGGAVKYCHDPLLLYRQHSDNVIGSNRGTRAQAVRMAMALGGRYQSWNAENVALLNNCRDLLNAEARSVLDDFTEARCGRIDRRIAALQRSRVFRQSVRGQALLYVACLLGKL